MCVCARVKIKQRKAKSEPLFGIKSAAGKVVLLFRVNRKKKKREEVSRFSAAKCYAAEKVPPINHCPCPESVNRETEKNVRKKESEFWVKRYRVFFAVNYFVQLAEIREELS